MENTNETTGNTVQLTQNDIILMCNIINVSSRRGAFEAGELSVVGSFFDQLKRFLPEDVATESAESTENDASTLNTSSEAEQFEFKFAQ